MDESSVLETQLQRRSSAIAYGISRALADLRRGKDILEARNESFDLQQYAKAGHCTAIALPGLHSQIETRWLGPGEEMVRRDFEQFLASRDICEQHQVPWKRGTLFLGPPGNGKTHCVKALVNALEVPCLYVQGFKTWNPFRRNGPANVGHAQRR